MIRLTQGSTADTFIVTLTEKCLLSSPNYLFVFTNVQSRKVTTKIFLNGDDQSAYKTRFNKFTINTSTVFNEIDQFIYDVYEMASTTNINPTGLNKVETGRLVVSKASPHTQNSNQSLPQFNSYDSQ